MVLSVVTALKKTIYDHQDFHHAPNEAVQFSGYVI